jgi:hypothetical protein
MGAVVRALLLFLRSVADVLARQPPSPPQSAWQRSRHRVEPGVTKVPQPTLDSIRPSSCRRLMAFRTVTGARSCSRARETMEGSRSPGASAPLSMRSRSRSASCCHGGIADLLLITTPLTIEDYCLSHRRAMNYSTPQ